MNICNYVSSILLTNFSGSLRLPKKLVVERLSALLPNHIVRSRHSYKKIDQTLFRQLPRDVLHVILSYYGDIVYRHGMYMNRIPKNDIRFLLYRPMIHTVAETSYPYFVFYTSTVYFEKRIPYIMNHLRNRGWTLFMAGVNEFHTNDTKSFRLKVYTSHYKHGINPTPIVTSFIVSIHTRNGYSSDIDDNTHYV